MELKGKVAIITGAGSGVGRDSAVVFAREGIKVAVCGRRKDNLKETVSLVEKEGGEALAIPVDVSKKAMVDAMVKKVLKDFGSIDILFNNAATFHALGAMWEEDPDVWWGDVEVNIRGPMLTSQAVLPHMIEKDQGIIVNTTAQAGTTAKPGCSAYAASKAALLNLTDTLAAELEKRNSKVQVFGMDPGFNRTEMTEELGSHKKSNEWLPGVQDALDSGRGNPPGEVGRTVINLMRLGDPVINGRTLRVGVDVQKVIDNADKIREEELLVMRFRHWK